jgi:uncharacterized membrane protein
MKWVNENHFDALPVALDGVALLMAGVAYCVLERALIAHHGADSARARAPGRDFQGIASVLIYAAAIALAFVNPWICCELYVLVAIMWFVPDPRVERGLPQE